MKKLVATLLLLTSPAAFADEAPAKRGWSFHELRLLPIQSGGRIKPFDSFAREAVLFETGSHSFEGWDPADLVFSWLTYPKEWQSKAFLKINRVDVRRQLGLEEKRTLFTPGELFSNFPLLQYAKEIDSSMKGTEVLSGKTDRDRSKSPREQELKLVLERLGFFRDLVEGSLWTIVPQPDGNWLPVATAGPIRDAFIDLVRTYQAKDESGFEGASAKLRSAVEVASPGWDQRQGRGIAAEVFYNRLHPFMYAWILYLAAALIWLVSVRGKKDWRVWLAGGATLGAFLFHTLGITLRCYIAGRPPVTNMYESIIWVSYGTLLFAAILYWIQKNPVTLIVASALATVGLIAADAAPAMMDPGLHPLVPVLRSNYWLTIHVLTITLSYSAFALTLGVANVTLFNFLLQDRARAVGDTEVVKQTQARITGLNLLTYRAMQFGIVLVAAGTILGGVWADYSWGRFWGWDPKEVWALIVTLTYVAIVHGRMTNWIGPFAFAVVSVAGFLSVLMAWYGVNFILGVGLHSYGFSTGGAAWVFGFSAAQLSYVAVIALHHFKPGAVSARG